MDDENTPHQRAELIAAESSALQVEFESWDFALAEVEESESPTIGQMIRCWRCHKSVSVVVEDCPFCAAPLVKSARLHEVTDLRPITQLLIAYSIILASSIALGLFARFAADARDAFWLQAFLTLFDSGLMIGSMILIRGAVSPNSVPSFRCKLLTWLTSPLVLLGLLATNFAIAHVLRVIVGRSAFGDDGSDLLWEKLVLFVLPPAVLEELFFRRLSVDVLARHVDRHSAIWLGGLMFGLAHIGQPFGIPYLCVFGVVLGYIRLGTGSLWLPMILHSIHNAVVILAEGQFYDG